MKKYSKMCHWKDSPILSHLQGRCHRGCPCCKCDFKTTCPTNLLQTIWEVAHCLLYQTIICCWCFSWLTPAIFLSIISTSHLDINQKQTKHSKSCSKLIKYNKHNWGGSEALLFMLCRQKNSEDIFPGTTLHLRNTKLGRSRNRTEGTSDRIFF